MFHSGNDIKLNYSESNLHVECFSAIHFPFCFPIFRCFPLLDFHECSWFGVENPCLVWAPDCLDCVILVWLGFLACAEQICFPYLSGDIPTVLELMKRI